MTLGPISTFSKMKRTRDGELITKIKQLQENHRQAKRKYEEIAKELNDTCREWTVKRRQRDEPLQPYHYVSRSRDELTILDANFKKTDVFFCDMQPRLQLADGRLVGIYRNSIRVLDLVTEKHFDLTTMNDHNSYVLLPLRNGNLVSAFSEILVWDLTTRTSINLKTTKDDYRVHELMEMPNGFLVSFEQSFRFHQGRILIWDVARQKCVRNIANVSSVAQLFDGRLIYGSKNSGIYDANDKMIGHRIFSAAFLGVLDGGRLLSASKDGAVHVDDLDDSKSDIVFRDPTVPTKIYSVVQLSEQCIVLSSNGNLFVWDLQAKTSTGRLPSTWGKLTYVSEYEFLCAGDSTRLWDIVTGKSRKVPDGVLKIFTPDDREKFKNNMTTILSEYLVPDLYSIVCNYFL